MDLLSVLNHLVSEPGFSGLSDYQDGCFVDLVSLDMFVVRVWTRVGLMGNTEKSWKSYNLENPGSDNKQ